MLRSRRVPEELLDVITYELISDPVIAEDNITYSRHNILDWFSQCKSRNEPITSPMTRAEIGETVRPNYPIQRQLDQFLSIQDNSLVITEPEAPSIAQLAKVFEVIDPIRDLLASIKWQPPAIVVLGNEKSGKSSLLERLAMIPIFPKAKQICTRMAIHVRLRRGPAKPPLVEVYDKVAGAVLRDMVIPMEKGNEYVNDAMERILMQENDGVIRGICNRKMLVLHVSSPSAPNLDLVDLPGLVSTFVRGEPENMQALTRELVENYIKENSTHSMYLVTVPARSATNQSLAMEVVQRYKLQSRTIGVLTKSDLYATIADDEIEQIENVRELCDKVYQRSSDVCPLPTYGYVATMNKPIREGQYATNYGALMYQAEREKEWFLNMGFSEIVESGHATMGALVNRLSSVYHNYMRHTWAPLTILRLERERVAISQREQALGLPRADSFVPPGQESNDEGMVPLEKIITMATELTIQLFKSQRTVIIDRICTLILKNFQAAIRSESISKQCTPAEAIELQRQAKLQLEAHCTSALDYLHKFMINEMKVILSGDKTSFCLQRFSNLTDAIMERSVQSLEQWRQDTENTMMNYVAMAFQNLPINPHLSVKYSFDTPQPLVKFTFDANTLSDVLPHVMVLRLSSLITDLLGTTVANVTQSLPDSAWIENCASERKAMLKTVRMIETAEAELMQVLFISQADMESFIGGAAAKDAVSEAPSRTNASSAPLATSSAAPPPASLSNHKRLPSLGASRSGLVASDLSELPIDKASPSPTKNTIIGAITSSASSGPGVPPVDEDLGKQSSFGPPKRTSSASFSTDKSSTESTSNNSSWNGGGVSSYPASYHGGGSAALPPSQSPPHNDGVPPAYYIPPSAAHDKAVEGPSNGFAPANIPSYSNNIPGSNGSGRYGGGVGVSTQATSRYSQYQIPGEQTTPVNTGASSGYGPSPTSGNSSSSQTNPTLSPSGHSYEISGNSNSGKYGGSPAVNGSATYEQNYPNITPNPSGSVASSSGGQYMPYSNNNQPLMSSSLNKSSRYEPQNAGSSSASVPNYDGYGGSSSSSHSLSSSAVYDTLKQTGGGSGHLDSSSRSGYVPSFAGSGNAGGVGAQYGAGVSSSSSSSWQTQAQSGQYLQGAGGSNGWSGGSGTPYSSMGLGVTGSWSNSGGTPNSSMYGSQTGLPPQLPPASVSVSRTGSLSHSTPSRSSTE